MFTTRSPMQKARKKSILLVHEDKNKHLFFSLRLAGFAIAAWVLLHNRPNIPKSASFKMSKAERLQKFFAVFIKTLLKIFYNFWCHNSEVFLPTVGLGFNAFMKMHLPTHTRRSEEGERDANTKKYNCQKSSFTNAKRSKWCVLKMKEFGYALWFPDIRWFPWYQARPVRPPK